MFLSKSEYDNLLQLYQSKNKDSIKVADAILKQCREGMTREHYNNLATARYLILYYDAGGAAPALDAVFNATPSIAHHPANGKTKIFNNTAIFTYQGARLVVNGKSKRVDFFCGCTKPAFSVDVSGVKIGRNKITRSPLYKMLYG